MAASNNDNAVEENTSLKQTKNTDKDGGDGEIIEEAFRFMHFAMGIYGWPMYLRHNTGIATCRLCSSLR